MPNSIVTLLFCIGFFALAVTLMVFVERRAFYRRNPYGFEQFSNFRVALSTTLLEWVLRLVARLCWGIACAMLVVFIIMRCAGTDEASSAQPSHVHHRQTRQQP